MSKSKGQYAYDHRLFDEIASEAKAYWRGFMTANANIYRNSPKLCLSLPNREIRKFRRCILLFAKQSHSLRGLRVRAQIPSAARHWPRLSAIDMMSPPGSAWSGADWLSPTAEEFVGGHSLGAAPRRVRLRRNQPSVIAGRSLRTDTRSR